jgi:hypothetical protein
LNYFFKGFEWNLPRNLQSGAQPSLAEKTRSLSEVLMKKLFNDIVTRAGTVVNSLQDFPDPLSRKFGLHNYTILREKSQYFGHNGTPA